MNRLKCAGKACIAKESGLTNDLYFLTLTQQKRKAKATSSTHEPAIKKKKGPKAKKTRSKKYEMRNRWLLQKVAFPVQQVDTYPLFLRV